MMMCKDCKCQTVKVNETERYPEHYICDKCDGTYFKVDG